MWFSVTLDACKNAESPLSCPHCKHWHVGSETIEGVLSLCCHICREEQFADIMSEREDIATKRTQCQNAVKALREALTALEALPTSLMQRLQAQSGESTSTSSRAATSTPASTSARMPSNDYDAALMSASPPYARGRRGPYNPRAMSQAAKMASDAMSSVSIREEVDMRRAESLANPFCYES